MFVVMTANVDRREDAVDKIDIDAMCEEARYADVLGPLLHKLGIVCVLRLEYESDYQGYVDIDALLNDGRVFSYYYGYGSCPGCDDWEDRNLTDDDIEAEMERGATMLDNMEQYLVWREMCDGKN